MERGGKDPSHRGTRRQPDPAVGAGGRESGTEKQGPESGTGRGGRSRPRCPGAIGINNKCFKLINKLIIMFPDL